MALPDKHQLKFKIHKDAKTLMEAIEKRLQKLISQLVILGETISQEDIKLKFLRSLPSEWKTNTLIWTNKADLEEQILDDWFNNLKIYEAEVKVSVVPSVSTASSKAIVSTLPNVDSLSNVVIYSFFASLGFDSQVFNRKVFDCEDLHSHESNNSVPTSTENDRYKKGEGYHVVPPLYTETFLPPKPDLVFNDAHNASDSVANVFNVESSTNKPRKDMSKTLRLDDPIIEDCISDSDDETELVSVPKQIEPSFVPTSEHVKTARESVKKPVPTPVPQSTVKSLRPVKFVVNKAHSPIRRPINHRPAIKNSNFTKKVTTVKVNKGNPQETLKDKGVIDSGCSRHITGNISFLLDFVEINGGYVAF
nr:hypothetical protein [Tanacetum cinerariifolium]